MTVPAAVTVSVRPLLVVASWRLRLIATLPALPLLAAQPMFVGLSQIATSPLSEDVPQTGLDLVAIGIRTCIASVILVAVLSLLLARREARHDQTSEVPTRVPWIFGLAPVATLAARAIALHRLGYRGTSPLALCLAVILGGGLIFLLELVLVMVGALQHSVPLS